jgi:hypothetical protein
MAMGERAQELAQRRRGIDPAEQGWHAAVADHVQVVDTIGSGEHARHDRGDLARSVGAPMTRDPQPFPDDAVQVDRLGQPHDGLQPGAGHEIRIVKRSACPRGSL